MKNGNSGSKRENRAHKNSADINKKMGTVAVKEKTELTRSHQKLKRKWVICYSERENGVHKNSAEIIKKVVIVVVKEKTEHTRNQQQMKNGNWQ